jgi:hypothetical protein
MVGRQMPRKWKWDIDPDAVATLYKGMRIKASTYLRSPYLATRLKFGEARQKTKT